MAKVKVKKQSTFIDMTAMSDVTVLLLTFFMFTSTFRATEPIQVTTPASVSEKLIPEKNLLTILLGTDGKIFMSFTNDKDKVETLIAMGEDYQITFTPEQIDAFRKLKSFGVPINSMESFLNFSDDQQQKFMMDLENPRVGIPNGEQSDAIGVIAVDNEFQRWVALATQKNPELKLAIKSDKITEYPKVKKIMDDLRDLRQNRYLLITSLKSASNI